MIGPEPFSTLCHVEALDALFQRLERDRSIEPGSVRRNYGQLLSKMVRWKLGPTCRNEIIGALTYQGTDPARELRRSVVTYAASARLLDELDQGYQKEGDEAARLYAEIAISLGTAVKTKSGTKSRGRYIWIVRDLLAQVRRYHRSSEPGALLFPLSGLRFDTIFQKARKRAGLMRAATNDTPIRPHDLRSVYAMLAEEAGIA